MALKVPPRNAVLQANHGGLRTEQRLQARGEIDQTVRLHAEENGVGFAYRFEISGCVGMRLEIAVGRTDTDAMLLNRAQMRASSE